MTQEKGFSAVHDHNDCKAELALKVIQGRWKVLIIREWWMPSNVSQICSVRSVV